MRSILPIATALSVLAVLYGCKEGCEDVLCAPAPAVLTVDVLDTVTVRMSVRTYDSTLDDTVDVIKDTTIVSYTTDATVELHAVLSGTLGPAFDSLEPVVSGADTSYIHTDALSAPSDTVAVVARRGDRADTLTGLTEQQVEGCCGYPIVGRYTMRLPEL